MAPTESFKSIVNEANYYLNNNKKCAINTVTKITT
jgi:hypothetical protein